jgi:competence protein ComEA
MGAPLVRTGLVVVATVVATTIAIGSRAGHAQAQLPDGLGKDEMIKVCGICHEPVRAASVRLTREGWEELVAKMVTLGATGTDEELAKVVDYLATHFKGEAAKPLNMNGGTAVELESVAGLLRKEAAAWIEYRKKTPCKTLDDLKKVPGLDFKKIDARRDYLVCF